MPRALSVLPLLAASLALPAAPLPGATPATPPTAATSPTPAAAIDPDVLALREAAWRAWLGGDEEALAAMLPADFVSISTKGEELSDLPHTLAVSRAFEASGGRLVRLSFPRTEAQRYGDVVILYSLYEVVLADAAGNESTLRGRATEVFLRRDGRWLHPGWHLDAE